VTNALAASAGVLPRVDRNALTVFLEEIFRWNSQLGVVSKRETPAVVARLLDESVRLWDFIDAAVQRGEAPPLRDVIDIGSGAGFPGIVWKLLVPSLRVTLVERKERKVAFLERVIARMGLAEVTAVAADIIDLARGERFARSADIVVMMAVGDPVDFAETVGRLLREPGYFCCVRAREQEFARGKMGRWLECEGSVEMEHGRFVLYRRSRSP
jgi:16S rRNA (guanine527-N7)-methyltransferase